MSDTVLIVDDSLTVRMDLQDAFEEAGFRTEVSPSVTAARGAIEDGRPDVIVLDVRLPDGDGVDLLREIRSQAETQNAVVLMLSSESEVKDRVRGLRMGADEYVGKPYDRHYMVGRAAELLRARRAPPASSAAIQVLLIDDSLTFREALYEALQEAGYAVHTASSGEEGLRYAGLARPGAVVVDGVLPGIDGATVIRRMRLDANLRQVPCLLMTGSEDIDTELQALDAGANAFVRKADDPVQIVSKLRDILHAAAASPEDEPGVPLGTRRILVVDANLRYQTTLCGALRQEGFDVASARCAEEALELLAVQTVDVILMDLALPGLGGRDACRRIKSAPVVRDIPLIIFTQAEDHGAMLDCLNAGADDFLQKSSDFEVLKARLRAHIRRKLYQDETRRVRLELLKAELEATEARAARALAESRAELLSILEQKNDALQAANAELKKSQEEIAQAYQELKSANQAKTDFLSTMSHELRTPLNAIIGFSSIMLNGITGQLTQQQREFIGHIHDGGQHLLALVNDILDLSKIEAGKTDIDLEPIHLDSLLVDAMSVIQERAAGRGITLRSQGLGTEETLKADRRRLKQILYNLLSNAVKFTPDHGEITLGASIVSREQAARDLPGFAQGVRMPLPEGPSQAFVQISIMDNGIGIAPGDMDKLFKPFMQIRNDLTRKVEGTGLGLATVLRLAQLHGGTVALTSESGKGSCFTIWLPWQANVPPQAHHDDAAHNADAARPLALVIEDDEKAASLMRIQLESAGFRVRHMACAEDALKAVPDFVPDLITLDIVLPGMDGWDFLARIKDLPSWASVPVVVVSVVANHEVGLSVGATAVMQKPIGPHEFMHELHRLGFHPNDAEGFKVLVVDDDPRAIELMSAYLQGPGYTVLKAFGGQEGIDMIRRHLPDLVVLDLLMPDLGGIEVVEALKQDEMTAQIPVIMVTAKQFSEAERSQLKSHVLSVVNKADLPDTNRFIGEVRRALGRRAVPA